MKILVKLLALMLLVSCNSNPEKTVEASKVNSISGSGKPTETEAVRLALFHQHIKLKDMQFCEHDLPGQTDESDIGDLFSYIFAEYGAGAEKQHIECTIREEREPPAGYSGKLWRVIVLQHVYVEENGAYSATGISFLVKDKNHEVIPTSFICAGVG